MSIDSKLVPTIDIIAAVRNEEEGIREFVRNIRLLNSGEVKIHIILVEDGSTDNTVAIIKEMAEASDDISFYSLTNPFGQGLALAYGILQSNSDASLTIDADGSHPYEIAEQMIKRFLHGAEIVQGNRIAYDRRTLYRKIGSKIYFILFTFLTGVNLYQQNVHFRLMNKEVTSKFKSNRKGWYSMRIKHAVKKKFRIELQDFVAPERDLGESKFNFRKLFLFAYRSFLTLTGVPSFVLLNFFLVLAMYFAFMVHPLLSVILGIFIVSNILFYIKYNSTNYLGRIRLCASRQARIN